MTEYTIDQYSKITDIPKINLRTWENRYGYLIPKRTSTNIRVYNDELLVRGLNTKLLLENGYKISKVSSMTPDEMKLAINTLKNSKNQITKINYYLNNFIVSAINFDEHQFNILFDKALKEFEFIELYKIIILPILQKIGILWLTNQMSPSQEHFLSELIKQKMYSLIDQESRNNLPSKEKWLLFLPENEFHEIGLLFAKYILVSKNYKVIYLGDNLPIKTLNGVVEKHSISHVLMFLLANYSVKMAENYIKKCQEIFKSSTICAVTNYTKVKVDSSTSSRVKLIHDLDSFIGLLENPNI
mgnify:CR=1 FL=1